MRLVPFLLCLAAPATAAPLAPTDLDGLVLGPFVEGPVGVTVDSSFVAGDVSTGDFSGGAACPEGFAACVPPDNPAGTVYRYVQTVVPGLDAVPNDPPFAAAPATADPGPVARYAVAFRPAGFTGKAGYGFADAAAAGVGFTLDRSADGLLFSVTEGEWTAGEGVRFFFETTRPPSGPGGAYALGDAVAPGPLPSPIPAPAALPLLAAGLLGAGLVRRRS